MKDQSIVGEALASVLPQYDRPWFRVPHLLELNLILLIPLLSSAVAGYDGRHLHAALSLCKTHGPLTQVFFPTRISHEWSSVYN
jgi:hypothetical protein